jgi:hypothetical protein
MKSLIALLVLSATTGAWAQQWKTLPKGVRILGYRNVVTSPIKNNFNREGAETSLGASFRVDASTFNSMVGNMFQPTNPTEAAAYNALVVGAYEVDATANVQVHGTGFGYGINDNVMFYGEIAYYNARVRSQIKRTAGNSYEDVARILEQGGGSQNALIAENLRRMIDANEGTIQSVLTNHYKYKPLGDWYGSGYGDMETGLMAKVVDRGVWGLQFYPGVILPTGRVDDPDILQDMGFGDGQFDLFGEVATGFVVNDNLMFGTTLRYTHQLPTTRRLRVPEERDFTLSDRTGNFNVKYGDRINWMFNSTISINDWVSFTPMYRFMYQAESKYDSKFGAANDYLAYNSDRSEHQLQLTTTLSSIQPFLKKKFLLPAQINMNVVQTVAGKNVPNVGRYEIEFRMLF